MKKLVYVVGHSRSGSTVLTTVLGNSKNIFAAGELNNFWISGLVKNEICSCRKPIRECDFWCGVIDDINSAGITDGARAQQAVANCENWRHFIQTIFSRRYRGDVTYYSKCNFQLFNSIFKQLNGEMILDSSKSPLRLYYLLKSSGSVDCKAIHIVRDPRSICWSMKKAMKKDPTNGVQAELSGQSIFRTMKSLYINNFIIGVLKVLNRKAVVTVNYDLLMSKPKVELSKIGDFLGIDLTGVANCVESQQAFQSEHIVAGNRMRMQKDIIVTPDNSWVNDMAKADFYITTFLTFPLIILQGFRLLPKYVRKNNT